MQCWLRKLPEGFRRFDPVVAADMPLLTVETLKRMMVDQQSIDAPMTMLTVKSNDSHGFGRILRGNEWRGARHH